jgi:hypothetical protein
MAVRADVVFRSADRPLGEPTYRPRSAFQANMLTKTLALLRREGGQLGAARVVVECDGPIRGDGQPAVTKLRSPAIRVFIDSRHGPLRYDVDSYAHWEDNLRAVALALEALRAVDRYGVTTRGEQYAGWKALPPGQVALGSGVNMSRDVALKIVADESGVPVAEDSPAELLALLIRKAKAQAHPDRHGGDRSRWNAVEQAARALDAEEAS